MAVTDVGGAATVAIPGGVTMQDEGTPIAGDPRGTLNFVGSGVSVTDVGGVGTVTVPGNGIAVQDEGAPIANNPHDTINFVGAVAASDAGGGVANVTIAGGSPMMDTTLTPAAITFGAAYDNWNPGTLGQTTLIRCTTDGATRNVRGLTGGVDGKIVCLLNVNPSVTHTEGWQVEDPAATPGNRFRSPFNSGGCMYVYDGVLLRWCIITKAAP